MQYLIVMLFIIVYSLFDLSLGYTTTSPFYTHWTFMFQHASIIHLVMNSLAFIGMFRVMKSFINKYRLFLLIVLISFAASFLSECSLPTVGCSSMVYALIGLFFGGLFCGIIRLKEKKQFYIFCFSVLSMMTFSFFNPSSNFLVHFFSLLFGFVVGIFNIILNKEILCV